MIKKPGLIFCLSVLISSNFFAQFNAVNYNKYPYINQDLNHLKIYGNKVWNKFFRKLILFLNGGYLNGGSIHNGFDK